jgi:hypothetical protein
MTDQISIRPSTVFLVSAKLFRKGEESLYTHSLQHPQDFLTNTKREVFPNFHIHRLSTPHFPRVQNEVEKSQAEVAEQDIESLFLFSFSPLKSDDLQELNEGE